MSQPTLKSEVLRLLKTTNICCFKMKYLRDEGALTLYDLLTLDRKSLLSFKGIGPDSITRIASTTLSVAAHNLSVKNTETEKIVFFLCDSWFDKVTDKYGLATMQHCFGSKALDEEVSSLVQSSITTAYSTGTPSMIIRALPSLGKSTLAHSEPDRFVDTDDFMLKIFGGISEDVVNMLFSSPSLEETIAFHTMLAKAIREGKTVLTNLNLDALHPLLSTDIKVGMTPDDYIQHISIADRPDLLAFGEEKLRSWASDFETMHMSEEENASVILLTPGRFLSDVVNDLNLHNKE